MVNDAARAALDLAQAGAPGRTRLILVKRAAARRPIIPA
jgi:hypothetical protein